MYPATVNADHRSDELMHRICDKIDLGDRVVFLNHIIEIPYRINGKERGIYLYTPEDIAAFALHNYLITRFEKSGECVRMFDVQMLPGQDRRGYPMTSVSEVEVKKIPTLFSREEIKWFVARYEYDFGDIEDKWNDLFAPKGLVREMYPVSTKTNHKLRA